MFSLLLRLAIAVGLSIGAVATAAPPVLVHVMPWYASKPFSGAWGWQSCSTGSCS